MPAPASDRELRSDQRSAGAPQPLKWPVIVSPLRQDGSIGLAQECVYSPSSSSTGAVAYILETYGGPGAIEESIEGRKFKSPSSNYPNWRLAPCGNHFSRCENWAMEHFDL